MWLSRTCSISGRYIILHRKVQLYHTSLREYMRSERGTLKRTPAELRLSLPTRQHRPARPQAGSARVSSRPARRAPLPRGPRAGCQGGTFRVLQRHLAPGSCLPPGRATEPSGARRRVRTDCRPWVKLSSRLIVSHFTLFFFFFPRP